MTKRDNQIETLEKELETIHQETKLNQVKISFKYQTFQLITSIFVFRSYSRIK